MAKKDFEILEAHTLDDFEVMLENAVNRDGYTALPESFNANGTVYAILVVKDK